MDENKIRQRLRVQEIGLEYLDQYNKLLRYVFQVTNQELFESGYKDGELIQAKRPILQTAFAVGWFDENDLISQVSVYPCEVNIHGKLFRMGGLTGVGTYPEYANLGLMNDLIRLTLENMRKEKQWISFLYPYSIPYYRKKGWEIINDHIAFTLKDFQLPKNVHVTGYVERHSIFHEDVIETYNNFSNKNHGSMVRNEVQWEEYWRWENEEERTAAIYYNEEEIPQGYILYWIANDIFHIKEMIYLNQEARNGLWNFISAHFSMVDEVKGHVYKNEPIAFLLDDSKIKEMIEPYYMGRIVDVEEFLNAYPFIKPAEKNFHFIISDPLANWNNRIFGMEWHDEKLCVNNQKIGNPIETDIQTLTSLLMSYRAPSYFYDIERLKTDKKTIRLLEDIIPDQLPYFSDYF